MASKRSLPSTNLKRPKGRANSASRSTSLSGPASPRATEPNTARDLTPLAFSFGFVRHQGFSYVFQTHDFPLGWLRPWFILHHATISRFISSCTWATSLSKGGFISPSPLCGLGGWLLHLCAGCSHYAETSTVSVQVPGSGMGSSEARNPFK